MEMKVELYISCRKLKDLDVFSKSDPIVHMLTWNERSRQWVKFGETELINNNLNPDFKKSFQVNYSFEKQQKLRFNVWDKDINDMEEIGYLETSMGSIMGARNQTQTSELKYDKSAGKRGQIIVRAESIVESNHAVIF